MSEPPKKPSGWRLFSWRTAVLAALILYTLIGFVVVPWIAKGVVLPKIGEKLGNEITVEKISCNPFTLALTLEGLSVADRSGAPMLSFDHMYANLQASSLFRWALVLKHLSIANPYVAVRRLPDGKINLLEVMEALKTEEPDPEADQGLPRAVFQEIRIDGGRFELEDQTREEPTLLQAGPAKLYLDDISTLPGTAGDNAFVIGLAEGGTVRIDGEVMVEPLGLSGSLDLDKAVIANLWPIIRERFEFDVVGGNVAASFNYAVDLDDGALRLRIDDAEFRLTELSLRTRADEDLASIGSITVSGLAASWPEQDIRAESLTIDGAHAQVWLEADGTPSWSDLVPKQTQDKIVETYKKV